MISGIKIQLSNQLVLILSSVVIIASPPGHGETFSFAIIADPHLNGDADHKTKFETAVDWIIGNKNDKDIELLFLLGDIAWGGSRGDRNLQIANRTLDRLNNMGIPYIPIIGDNEVHAGCEKEFEDVFEAQYRYLSKILQHWQKASVPVNGRYLQNFSFDYKDCHFVCVDFISRRAGDEGGELHDYAGGSWPWFKNNIEHCPKPKKENILIMTHIGMFRTGFQFADRYLFSENEMSKIKHFLYDYRDYVDSNYAGHLHQNWYAPVWSGLFVPLYHVRVTDETWYDTQWPENKDQELTVRWVQVSDSGSKISYHQNIENIIKEMSVEK
jgi:hypothetical protein